MKRFYKILFAFFLMLSNSVIRAQTDDDIHNHVIIVIDERIKGWSATDTVIRDKVLEYLFNPIVVNGDTLYDGKNLYKHGDFLSIVTFSISKEDISANAFTGTKFKFVPYSNDVENLLRDKDGWKRLAAKRNLPGERHSIFSLAISHAMRRCVRENDMQLTNRTFALMITDRSYSDKDYYDDIRDFTDAHSDYMKELGKGPVIRKYNLLDISQSVSKDYFINWINRDERRYQFWPDGYQLRTKNVDLYELQPIQEHLRMSAVVRYPEHIVAKRGKWGHYTATLQVTPENTKRFNVLRLSASLALPGSELQELEYSLNSADSTFVSASKTYNLGRGIRSDVGINLRLWVNLKDGFYEATVLTPSAYGDKYLGKDGLNVFIPVDFEPKAMTVFGLMPLWDIFCFSGNQDVDATVINLLLILLTIVVLLVYIIRNRYYEPVIDDISITFKNREKK